MTNSRQPTESRGIARGVGIFVILYGLSWATAFTGVITVGIVITGLTVLAGLVLVFAGRTPQERGTGAGILIGAAIGMLVFAGCLALVVNALDH